MKKLRDSLPPAPPALACPVMVLVSGLPGTGKSYFARRLSAEVPLLVLESDTLRKVLFPYPTYSGPESSRLFRACHSLIAALLEEGVPILVDATNLLEDHRESLYQIADRLSAGVIVVSLSAPPAVVRQRLAARSQGVDPEDHSGADWQVYRMMQPSAEPIRRNHYVVDTSRDISPVISKVAKQVSRWTSATD